MSLETRVTRLENTQPAPPPPPAEYAFERVGLPNLLVGRWLMFRKRNGVILEPVESRALALILQKAKFAGSGLSEKEEAELELAISTLRAREMARVMSERPDVSPLNHHLYVFPV